MRAVPGLAKARAWRSVATVVDSHVSDPRIRQLLGFHPLLIGGNPFDSPSIYALIHAGGRIVRLDAGSGRIVGEVPGGGFDRLAAVVPW